MSGDFKTDITRDTFHKRQHFSRVLMQQGRVQLDADWNEQTDILLHYTRTLASDIIGPHAGPKADLGFVIGQYTPPHQATTDEGGKRGKKGDQSAAEQSTNTYTVTVEEGRYYVDGILCELDRDIKQYVIEDEEQDAAKSAKNNVFLFYLDVWEREVTYQEDDSIREVALGGPDTATRAQVTCQVRAKALASLDKFDGLLANIPSPPNAPSEAYTEAWTEFVRSYAHMFPAVTSALPADPRMVGRAYLKARTLVLEDDEYTDPCTVPPSSQYRGAENQLYRVEVHTSGYARPNPDQHPPTHQQHQTRQTRGESEPQSNLPYATFKWSRENGSVVFPIISPIDPGTTTSTLTVTVSGLGRDDSRFTLNIDDWVEIVDYEDTLELEPGKLMRVTAVDQINMQVSLAAPEGQKVSFDTDSDPNKPFLLRRWDYHLMDPDEKGATTLDNDGALEIIENHWLTLENGIQVQFHRERDTHPDNDPDDLTPFYHTGDYWLIPARTATGDIEWPHKGHEHYALPPHGVEHHYAPLAYVVFGDDHKTLGKLISLQRSIEPIGKVI